MTFVDVVMDLEIILDYSGRLETKCQCPYRENKIVEDATRRIEAEAE